MMTPGSLAGRLLHAAVAIALLGWLASVLVDRRSDVAQVRELTAKEHAESERIKAELIRSQALRDGLRRDDPYVIEFMARDRLQYTGPGELNPPPAR